ncbi:MAG: cytochrome [Flavipsychrobacter sp.]|nr:cytochrome [Flavipsychrobacter sp.]
MHSNKKAVIFSAVSALLLPAVSFAATTTPDEKAPEYNMTLLCLVGLILILVFVIGMVGNTLRQLTAMVREKNRKERQSKANAAKTTLVLLLLFSSFHSFAGTWIDEFMMHTPKSISGIPTADFYTLVGIISLELLVIFVLTICTNIMLKIIRNIPDLQVKATAVVKKNWFWDKFNSAASIEKEKDILLDHNYDGIMELDNSLPPWWKYGFYVTILVSFIYVYRFHVSHDGLSQLEEYTEEMRQGEEDKAEYLAKSANNVDENTVTLLTSGTDVAAGKETFVKNCAACHLADGGGTVGPNLTDDYWLHGGGLKDIFKTIKYGWQDKGMKSWKDDLSPKQIQEVASFIKSLKGTHPLTPKAPQGDIYLEAVPKENTDSAKTPKIAGK